MFCFLKALKTHRTDVDERNERRNRLSRITPIHFCGFSSDVGNTLIAGADEQILSESWNETHINLSIPLSSLSTLSFDEGWTARFVFGKNELTDSFTFLKTLKERKAESLQQTLPWLIPVIVCSVLLLLAVLVVVVVVVCRRRRQTAKSDSSTLLSQQELSEDDVAKMEVEMHAYPTTNGLIGH
ncbi:hypothetical protein BLNAU_5486 [Blattamonas nauphoetae]|uniref:Uncharacterized protein n=1 Tax=Blattamonas nauphoetae TaxID=2049346 RepID=A0ABQ9Y6S1_9EUKA|nr:hypothetical protein BLNAU_5486 [Blattamonas nauphoetae]